MVDRHVRGERLSAFLDDELAESDALAATRHLAACARCRDELSALRDTRDALRRLPSLQAPVLVAAAAPRPERTRTWGRRARRVVLACIAPAAAVTVLYLAGADQGQVEPTTELFLVEHVGRTSGHTLPMPLGGPR